MSEDRLRFPEFVNQYSIAKRHFFTRGIELPFFIFYAVYLVDKTLTSCDKYAIIY